MKIEKELEKEWRKNIVKKSQILKIHKDIKEIIKNQNKNMKKVVIKETEKKIEERKRK